MDDLPDIHAIDWSLLEHADGKATDVPELWERLLTEGDPLYEIGSVFCCQRTLTSAGCELTPFLIALARSSHRSRADALRMLYAFLTAQTGLLAMGEAMAVLPAMRNPRTGEWSEARRIRPAPDPSLLRFEEESIERSKQMIEAFAREAEPLVEHPELAVRLEALALLCSVRDWEELDLEALCERALSSAKTPEERALTEDRMDYLAEEAEADVELE